MCFPYFLVHVSKAARNLHLEEVLGKEAAACQVKERGKIEHLVEC